MLATNWIHLLPGTLLLLLLDVVGAQSSNSSSKLRAGWYPGWRSTVFPVDDISWSKYDHLAYAFGVTTPDPAKISLEESGGDYLEEFVKAAHDHNVKASLAIGGWSGSRYFSTAVGSQQNRTTFINALTDLVDEYKLDGLDFDWEFPNAPSVGCNIHTPEDVPNYISFLRELRQTPKGSSLVLSAAVFVHPFNDTSTPPKPMTDMKEFGELLDFVELMNYDVYNLWAPVAGPNAPLNDTCSDRNRGSAVSSVKLWTEAGVPANKLVLGIPYYARSFTVARELALDASGGIVSNPSYDVSKAQLGDKNDGAGPDVCGVQQPPTGTYSYQGLLDTGRLKSNGSPSDGISYKWDDCSQTPILYNATSQVYISYDDPRSLAVKGAFINDLGLMGFAAWDVTMDHDDSLLDSMLNALTSGSSIGAMQSDSSGAEAKAGDSPNSASNSSPLSSAVMLLSFLFLVSFL